MTEKKVLVTMLLMPCGLAHVRTLQLWITRPVVLIYTRIVTCSDFQMISLASYDTCMHQSFIVSHLHHTHVKLHPYIFL